MAKQTKSKTTEKSTQRAVPSEAEKASTKAAVETKNAETAPTHLRDATKTPSTNDTSMVTPDPLNRTVPPPTTQPTAASELGTPAVLGNDPGVTHPEEPKSIQRTEAQEKLYNAHKSIEWETTEEANIAEAITRYAFGEDKETEDEKGKKHAPKGFTLKKHLAGASEKKVKQTREIAKKIGLDDVLHDDAIKTLTEE